jgi:hypothetical protein
MQVLYSVGVLESLLATIGIAGMCAGMAYAWAGAVGNGAGIRVRRPPRKRTEPQRGSWLVVVGLRFCVGCPSVAVV